jgi:hypothetical protein
MKRLYFHDILTSFTLWFDHTLLDEGAAFSNVSTNFYNTKDSFLKNKTVYASPYKQWVYDSSISGVQIPSDIFLNSSQVNRGVSGLMLDFQHGRAIFNPNVSTQASVSGNYSVKDFNIYRTTESDQRLIFENKIQIAPIFPQTEKGIDDNSVVGPCIFLKMVKTEYDTFEFGGTNKIATNMRAVIISDSDYKLDAVGSIFASKINKNFAILPVTPLNEYGDIKGGQFNYNTVVAQNFDQRKLGYISMADYSRLENVSAELIQPGIHIGFIDFKIEIVDYH